jgi:hypothetical protein
VIRLTAHFLFMLKQINRVIIPSNPDFTFPTGKLPKFGICRDTFSRGQVVIEGGRPQEAVLAGGANHLGICREDGAN